MLAVPRPWDDDAPIESVKQHINLPELPDGWWWKMYYSDPCAETHDRDSYGWITAPSNRTGVWSWTFKYRLGTMRPIRADGFPTPQAAIDALMVHIYLGV